jgi:beta-phosphoglucomutase
MLGAVIFDFDGVITDSEILHFRAFNQVLAPHGMQMTQKEYYSDYLGLSDLDCFTALIREGKLGLQESSVKDLGSRKTRFFEELARKEGSIIAGVREFLDLLASNKIPLAICSGALRPEIELILEDANLRGFFDEIVSAEQVKRGKPHPDGFLLALKKLNARRVAPLAAKQCVVIEDSQWGLQAAKSAGMHTIAVTNSYDAAQLSAAEKIVPRLDTLTLNDLTRLCA